MTLEPRSVRLARRWAAAYTRGLPPEVGRARRLELESDLWEHLNDPAEERADHAILGRTLRGVHADVWWRYRTLLDQRGARQRSHDMTAAQARGWWRPTTTVIGIMVLAMGLLGLAFGEATDGGAGGAVAAASALVSGGLLLGGLVRQRRHHAGGSRLVFGGAVVLALGDPLLIPLSLLVIIGGQWSGSLAISARADQRPVRLEASRASLTAGWYRWLVAAIALAAVGFATLAIWPAITPDRCTEGNVCWEDTAAWATWILSWLAAAVTGTIGAALLLLRLVDRHHTRTA